MYNRYKKANAINYISAKSNYNFEKSPLALLSTSFFILYANVSTNFEFTSEANEEKGVINYKK